MELKTNGAIVRDALNYVNGKAERLGHQVKAEEEIGIEGEPEQEAAVSYTHLTLPTIYSV